jgi:antitoxin VapB
MGQLNLKDEALIAEAKALAELLGTSTTDAVRQAVHDRLEQERAAREEEYQRRYEAIMAAARDLREALGGEVMSNAELDAWLYDPETGVPR